MKDGRVATRALAFAIALAIATTARADGGRADATPAQLQAARALFADASKDEDAGRWDVALEKLHRVAEVKLTAGIRYHVALCEEKLGQTATALAHYGQARDAAQVEHNAEVAELLKEPFLSDLRARVPSLTLSLARDVADARDVDVTLDGRPLASSAWGVAMSVDPGTHRVEARAPGRQPFTREITMRERDVSVMDVTLRADPPAPEPRATIPLAPSAAPASPVAATAHAPTRVERAAAASSGRGRSPAGNAGAIVATATAIALAGGGVGAYVVADAKASDARAECATLTRCDGRASPIRTWDGIALGAWIGAAALGTAAIVLWATPSRAGRAQASRVVLGASSLRLEGRF